MKMTLANVAQAAKLLVCHQVEQQLTANCTHLKKVVAEHSCAFAEYQNRVNSLRAALVGLQKRCNALNENENVGTSSAPTTSTNGLIELEFTKDNDSSAPEHIKIHLKDYFLDSTTWTIPDDKGPITVEATVKPRNLHLCTVKTHWILQG